ncbi:MAG: hypothetical protein K2V38_16150 [Gemmataceae bacterium]|nr:hypothetical protein [Gemmataceae bacterium]
MDMPPHISARGYERAAPHDPLFGRYIRLDLSARPDLADTFDAVAKLVRYGQQAAEVVPFARVAWAVVGFGVEPADRVRVAEFQLQYVAMWERHPDLWPQLRPRGAVFSAWLVDRALRPFLGCVCDEEPWDVWTAGRDVRQERLYQKESHEEHECIGIRR